MSFIPYQIDHKVIGAGKTLGISKKRITFKFGFANRDALSEGLTGAACRGSEHEVVLVLSLASGKRHVLLDGREVHFSQAEKMSNRGFDFPFSIRIPSVGAVQARLLTDSQPGSQPYNFYINGMSYFHFSKIYELGTPTMRVGQLTEQRSYASQFTSNSELEAPPEERRLIAQAKLESMRELREKQEREAAAAAPKQMNHEEGNLINFDDDDVGAPPPVVPQQGGMMYHASSLTMDPALQQSQTFPPQQSFPPSSGPAYQNYSLNTSAPPPPPATVRIRLSCSNYFSNKSVFAAECVHVDSVFATSTKSLCCSLSICSSAARFLFVPAIAAVVWISAAIVSYTVGTSSHVRRNANGIWFFCTSTTTTTT